MPRAADYNKLTMVTGSAAFTLLFALFAAALLADGTHLAVVVGSTGCECLGITLPDAAEGEFPDNYGMRCAAHDILTGGTLWRSGPQPSPANGTASLGATLTRKPAIRPGLLG